MSEELPSDVKFDDMTTDDMKKYIDELEGDVDEDLDSLIEQLLPQKK